MLRVFGCGNPDRGDDSAGPLVVQRLRALGIDAGIHTGDALRLLDQWNPADDVILVDAIATGAPVGTVRVWDSVPVHIPAGTATSSHGFDIAKAIHLGHALGKLPVRLRIYGIEGRQFDAGAAVSPEVEDAIEAVVRQIAFEIEFDKDRAPAGASAYPQLKAIS